MAFAENACKLTAICKRCGEPAPFTHRTIQANQVEVIGGEEIYMAVCRDCYKDLNRSRFTNKLDSTEISIDDGITSCIENIEPLMKKGRMHA